MNSWWWAALAVVVLLALVATVSDARGRGGRGPRRPGGRTRPPGRAPERKKKGRPHGGPRPGEIWWADVPFEDGPGSKDRPCLVLSVRGGTAVVAKITSKHHEERPGVIALPAGSVGDARGRQSYLETDELREVALAGFRRKAGELDPGVWGRVRDLG
ncbi:type II toxin-antitoxin system PemK/MazF family toxin [Streptomyces sp. HB132]|uniref:type II toxin-antitoxin system PemK/MazF family toxin n=1 Tax=Streptomyces sp. HB132 TaxID=767388 RepID=UPI00195FE453|nr:type II toxin-antitoxin system PemK/MazF family toxin [Streptomyces sp. HB132]MBM7438841.1 mRNA-degrading endonuclease toxin of MazEF toxin-antitoxin module [Streptomyces sp. HB132]